MSGKRVLIMAGGTGGHVYPALAVAEALRERGHTVSWLGTAAGLEARLVPEAGIELDTIHVSGLRGKGPLGWLLAPVRVLRAAFEALGILRRRRPDVVLGLGGFASGPGGLAAWLLRRPLVIHEQNAAPGLTNRLLSHLAARVLEAFPRTFPDAVAAEATGNPVRQAIRRLPPPAERFAAREGPLRLLVFGGSQGALALNEAVPTALAALPEGERPQVHHQSGPRHLEATRQAYSEAGVEAEVAPYVDDMAAAYAWADLVICRAGALTVSELAVAGVPAVLVPFPFAVDDHQTRNALYLVDADAARLLPQDEMTTERLGAVLEELLGGGREGLAGMAEAARGRALPEATERVVAHCLEMQAKRAGEWVL